MRAILVLNGSGSSIYIREKCGYRCRYFIHNPVLALKADTRRVSIPHRRIFRITLTDTRIRNAKPSEKPYKMADGGGLYIEVKPTGAKLWRLRYRLSGKENAFAIGDYRLIGLAEARAKRDEAKKLIKQGVHPSHQRKLERIRQIHEHANSFS